MKRPILFLALGCALSGCTPATNALLLSAKELLPRGAGTAAAPLDPKFAYLRVTRGKHVGLLWHGSTEQNAHGPVHVYYSGQGEVLRLQEGRILGAVGVPTEWRNVAAPPLPSWHAIAKAAGPLQWERTRDVMPGYRYGVRDRLVLRRIEVPGSSALRALAATDLLWFEERVEPAARPAWSPLRSGAPSSDALPAARYAVHVEAGRAAVIYGEQCLAADFCFTWQHWSAAMESAAAKAKE